MRVPAWAVDLEITQATDERLSFQYTSPDLKVPRRSPQSRGRGVVPPTILPDIIRIRFDMHGGVDLVFVEAELVAYGESPEKLVVIIRQRRNMAEQPIAQLLEDLSRRLFDAGGITLHHERGSL